ncbi:MAG: tetratricopeptide repeat protein [Candidatus Cloacimonetes bacterium]|nr:tetratricopeptide repeat protein [Candidatus Cloacimonadota bacterium]MDD3562688.1 tetratricopeptide repeat protein [Candidatus Cloacimonadota bacterium]MDD4276614.1 tetratricopeptide repeat protein [Candidatus Cloacimonadota bacterium]
MSKYSLLTLLILFSLQFLLATSIQQSYLAEANGDYAGAITHMQKLLRDEPTEVFYSMRTAWLYYLLGSYQEALNLYQQSLSRLDHLDAHLGIINCQLALGQWDQALASSQKVLPTNSQNTILLSKAAYAAFMNKAYGTAADYFGFIVASSPWDLENRGYWVNNLYLSGNLSEAKKQYRILKKYHPDSQIVLDLQKALDTP